MKNIRWSEFGAQYLVHAASYKKSVSIKCVDRPAVKSLGRVIGDPIMDDLTTRDADKYVAHSRKTLADSSLRTRLICLRQIMAWGVSEGIISRNIFHDVHLPRGHFAGRVLSDSEIEKFLSHLEDAPRRACVLAFYTGMRRGEIAGLQWDQVRSDHIHIPAEKSKSGKPRTIMINAFTMQTLGERRSGRDSVFGLTRNAINTAVTMAWRASGLGKIRFHDLRHTACARFFEKSEDVFAAMDAFGWASPASAVPYQHMTRARQSKILGVSYPFLEA